MLNRIRKLPGFAAFQAPTSIYELQNIAAQFGGPLVYAAATQHGTLILFVEAQGVRGVWTGLTNTRLSELLVRKRKDGRWTGFLPTQLGLGDILENSLRELLPVLEDQLVAPLREQLLRLSYKRVGLVLTGKLSLLPVSACLLDDVCVHLQVNGRSLSSAEDEARRRLGVETVLAVGNPLPSENPLPAAELEAAMAAAHFSQPTLMAGTAVGAIRVIEGLQSASHLHLACHGYLAAEDALQSALHLGGPNQLTVRDLLFGSSLPKSAKLAVLSACQSAVPDFARLPDEIIGLPVAFLQAGVPTVVGTLWPVADYSTALVMDRFYQAYIRDRVAPAEALRSAPQWLRSVTAGELETYFKAARRKAGTELDVPYEAVSAAWRYFLAMPPDSTPFKSPVYWAPFVCYGSELLDRKRLKHARKPSFPPAKKIDSLAEPIPFCPRERSEASLKCGRPEVATFNSMAIRSSISARPDDACQTLGNGEPQARQKSAADFNLLNDPHILRIWRLELGGTPPHGSPVRSRVDSIPTVHQNPLVPVQSGGG